MNGDARSPGPGSGRTSPGLGADIDGGKRAMKRASQILVASLVLAAAAGLDAAAPRGKTEKKTEIVVKLLDAKPVKGGVYNIIINPQLAGVFVHEAFGHFSESDLIEDSPTMREKMKIGAELGAERVNIKDDPTLPDQRRRDTQKHQSYHDM